MPAGKWFMNALVGRRNAHLLVCGVLTRSEWTSRLEMGNGSKLTVCFTCSLTNIG